MAISKIPSYVPGQAGNFSSGSPFTVTFQGGSTGMLICTGSAASRLSLYMFSAFSGNVNTAPVLDDANNTLTSEATNQLTFSRSGNGTISVFILFTQGGLAP